MGSYIYLTAVCKCVTLSQSSEDYVPQICHVPVTVTKSDILCKDQKASKKQSVRYAYALQLPHLNYLHCVSESHHLVTLRPFTDPHIHSAASCINSRDHHHEFSYT